ncbi:MAG: TatD family hydrolase [Bacilli bacterium]|nr:TatD family hydrolase [Bacilli bacterium]
MLIDSHCHLSHKDYEDVREIINNMEDNIMIVSGADHESNIDVVKLCSEYHNIYGVLGIHPTEITNDIEKHLKYIEVHINDRHIVGIGEIGLDYHYECDKELQKEIFIRQIQLALQYKKPIVIHTRDAIQDTYDILNKENAYQVNVTIHCFSESLEMAKSFIKKGAKLGVGGIITFKNAKKIQEVVQNIDIKHILLETDSPYLAPVPLRGTKNEPKNVYLVAKKIAELKGMDIDNVITITTNNTVAQFDLK